MKCEYTRFHLPLPRKRTLTKRLGVMDDDPGIAEAIAL